MMKTRMLLGIISSASNWLVPRLVTALYVFIEGQGPDVRAQKRLDQGGGEVGSEKTGLFSFSRPPPHMLALCACCFQWDLCIKKKEEAVISLTCPWVAGAAAVLMDVCCESAWNDSSSEEGQIGWPKMIFCNLSVDNALSCSRQSLLTSFRLSFWSRTHSQCTFTQQESGPSNIYISIFTYILSSCWHNASRSL